MDVAILLSTLGRLRGGLETRASCLGTALARRGHRVTLVAPLHGDLLPDLAALPVNWLRVPCPEPGGSADAFHEGCRQNAEARRLIAGCDATLTFFAPDTAHFSAWRRSEGRGHVSYYSGGGRAWLERDLSTVRLVNPMTAKKSRSAADFPFDGELLPGVPDALLATPFEVRPRGNRVLCVGRLEPNKGVSELLDLFLRLGDPEIELRYVGDGPLREPLERVATARVSFAGAVSQERVWEEMRAADLMIHPSSCESFCFTLLEAQAVGLPFVSSDLPGIRGAVPDSSPLLPLGDWDLWLETIRNLLGDYEERRRLSDAGREWASRYTWEGPVAALEGFLRLAVERTSDNRSSALSTFPTSSP
jgi:glycosyltransferase involved in cell wall biosynthesis